MHAARRSTTSQPGTATRRAIARRLKVLAVSLVSALLLSACGGGGEVRASGDFNVGIVVGGQFLGATPVAPGGSVRVVVRAGQSVRVDAGEPVVWTLFVGGSAVNANGVQVRYAGADIAATVLTSTAIQVDTYAAFFLANSVPFTLVATSTYDSAQVVTADVLITN